MTRITDGETLLFIGDSLTDCGRGRNLLGPNDRYALGCGYVQHIAQVLLADRPTAGLRIFNRGIAGNRSHELAARWEADCLALAPTRVTVLIGVNDTWHRFAYSMQGVAVAEAMAHQLTCYEALRQRLPSCQLTIMLPFLLPVGTGLADLHLWQPEFNERREATRQLAGSIGATCLDLQEVFDRALHHAPASAYSEDGVHPGPGGHALIARAWLSLHAQTRSP